MACLMTFAGASNIVELAESVPDLSILVKLVVAANLTSTLESPGPFTVFAPTNEAFESLGSETLERLLDPKNKDELVKVLTYHVVGASVHSKDLKNDESVPTVEGSNVTVHIHGSEVFINDAKVAKADVDADNGVVHIVEKVLVPPAAPTEKNIVQLAEEVPELSILVKLIEAADLVDTLSGTGPFTVFAPLNNAFERDVGKEELEELLKPENKAELTKILTYHVAAGSVHSKDLKNHERIKTVEGDDVTAYIVHEHVFINHARVVKADNDATNGVVHVTEGVLIPPKH